MGYLPITDEFALFGKVGAVRWRTKTNDSIEDVAYTETTESGVSFAGGVGASYFFNDDVGIRMEYEVIQGGGEKGEIKGSDVYVASVGLMLRF